MNGSGLASCLPKMQGKRSPDFRRDGGAGSVYSPDVNVGEIYNDLGGDYFARRDPKTTKRLVAQLERLGHTVTQQEAHAA